MTDHPMKGGRRTPREEFELAVLRVCSPPLSWIGTVLVSYSPISHTFARLDMAPMARGTGCMQGTPDHFSLVVGL